MSSNTIIEAIRKYFYKCPLLDRKGMVRVDYTSDKPLSYSINTMPGEKLTRPYVGGGGIKEYNFNLTVTNDWSSDIQMNMENIGFQERLEDWIDKQNKEKMFPKLPPNKKAIRVKVTSSGYLFSSADKVAVYQMQFKLFYIDY